MPAFDLVLRLFGLLLGLAMGEVLAGFARTLRLKLGAAAAPAESVRVGWLVPLLGLLIVLSQLSFWLAFYELRGDVPLNLLTLLGIMAVVGAYYVVSGLVFPAHPERWPDFDAYYFQVRRAVVGGLIAVEVAAIAYGTVRMSGGLQVEISTGNANALGATASLLFLPVLGVLMVVRGRAASLVLLCLANAIPLLEAATRFR